ncbi:hypothetical protein [Escherichia coli]|uniref:hypothetical protein n=1 Tax=Escherichia coli TaxID=562 RepID=UPI000CFB6CE3|nr:hypothetical protein [Escherichia coli]
MKAILFDLDNTLFSTSCCNVYLRSRAGRNVICDLIQSGRLNITPLDPGIVNYVNQLNNTHDIDVFIISDSPKDYCLTILRRFGMNIDEEKVIGSMHKPCIENEELFSTYSKVLVIGDTPKDIFLAHRLKAASIFLTCLTEYDIDFSVNNSLPYAVASSFEELEQKIREFVENDFEYETPYFKTLLNTVDPEGVAIVDIPDEDIGYVFKYIPDLDEIDNQEDKNTWFKIHRSIKPAKILSYQDLDGKKRVSFYNQNNTITDGMAFRDIAWFARLNFCEWIKEKNITGKVYLVAAPSSVPRECNQSLPMGVLVNWWVKWLPYVEDINIRVLDGSYVERFWPTTPSHMSKGKREIRPHFNTLGVFKDAEPFDADTSAIIIVDDVVTSGTQMKAVASLLVGTNMVPEGAKIYGYALAKTMRNSVDLDFTALLAAFSKAEKAGG